MAPDEITRAPQVFSDAKRTSLRTKRDVESSFSYIDASARPPIAWARSSLEIGLVTTRRTPGQSWLRRFRSKDDRQHESAFFELYCHELLIRHGFAVETHPLSCARSHDARFSCLKEWRSIVLP